jgi:hypothetical protein
MWQLVTSVLEENAASVFEVDVSHSGKGIRLYKIGGEWVSEDRRSV